MSNSIQEIKKTDEEIFFPEGKKVVIAKEDFYIKPFVLKNRSKFLKIFAEITMEFVGKNPEMQEGNVNFSNMITEFINAAGDRLINIYKLIIDKDEEWLLDNITIKNEIDIIEAVFEVNNFPLLISQIQGMIAKANMTQTVE